MSIQFKRGTGSANDSYTGPDGSISVDFTNELIRVHDGSTPGGVFSVGGATAGTGTDLSVNYATSSFTIDSSTGSNAVVNGATTSLAGAMSSTDKTKLDGVEEGAQVNRVLATQAASETATDNTASMSPLRTKQLIEAGNYAIDEGVL